MRRLVVDAASPDGRALEDAAFVIRSGGIVAVPTDTLYGLAVDPFNVDAMERLFAAKDRPADRAVALIAADLAQVVEHVGRLPPQALRLASRFWPGPLTILIRAPEKMAQALVGSSGSVGVRVPAHAVAQALCRASERPLTATSANVSGQPPPLHPDAVERALAGRIDMLIDAGPAPGGLPSTIVDASTPQVRLVRAGAIPWSAVQAVIDTAS